MRRHLSDRVLRRWLATGKPGRVALEIERDPAVAARIDELSALTRAHNQALETLVTPDANFDTRTTTRLHDRVDALGTAGAMFDMLGLGLHVSRALFGNNRPHPDPEPEPHPDPEPGDRHDGDGDELGQNDNIS